VAERDAFSDRRRGQEEEYFRKRERELIEKMRKRAADEANRRALGQQTGLADEEILEDLRSLGYTSETVMLLHVVPLVQIAWAEGSVSDAERALIVKAARSRGVAPGSAADLQLTDWLTNRPSDEFFERTLRAIGAVLEARAPDERDSGRRDLLSYLSAIAEASGGLLGFGAVSSEERQLLARVTAELERSHASAARQVMSGEKKTQ
jgi:hypothetical protein